MLQQLKYNSYGRDNINYKPSNTNKVREFKVLNVCTNTATQEHGNNHLSVLNLSGSSWINYLNNQNTYTHFEHLQ